jgi:hypothetical protein
MAATAVQEAPPLNDLMLAMDVVDTLRHGEALVERELSAEERRTKMIERLREIYRQQGITVPDRVLAEGVAALEENRFVYKPRTGGFAFTLARLYVRRGAIGKTVGIAAAIIVAVIAGYIFLIRQPAQRDLADLRNELTALPATIVAEAVDPVVDAAAQQTAADGLEALDAGNRGAARDAVESLQATLNELRAIYDVRIVSRPGADTAVTRIPPNNVGENFYVIVEAIGPDGELVPRSIRSEEDQTTQRVEQWGVRVPEATFNAIVADKTDDGIVQNAVIGDKPRGELAINWRVPTLGGFIHTW